MDGLGLVYTGQDNSGAAAVLDEATFNPTDYWKGRQKSIKDDIDKAVEAKKLAEKAGVAYTAPKDDSWVPMKQAIVTPQLTELQNIFFTAMKSGVKNPDLDPTYAPILADKRRAIEDNIAKTKYYEAFHKNAVDALSGDIKAGTNVFEQKKSQAEAQKFLDAAAKGDTKTMDEIMKSGIVKRQFNPVKAAEDLNKMLGEKKTYDDKSITDLGAGTNDYKIKTLTTASPEELKEKAKLYWEGNQDAQDNYTLDEFYKFAEKAKKQKEEEEVKSKQSIDKSTQQEWMDGGSLKIGNNIYSKIKVPIDINTTPEGEARLKANWERQNALVKQSGGKAQISWEDYKAQQKPIVANADAVSITKANTGEATQTSGDKYFADDGTPVFGSINYIQPIGDGKYEGIILVDKELTEEQKAEGGNDKYLGKVLKIQFYNDDKSLNPNGGKIKGEWGGLAPDQIYKKMKEGDTKGQKTTPAAKTTPAPAAAGTRKRWNSVTKKMEPY